MNNEAKEYQNTSANPLMILTGILIGGLTGAVAMLFLAPQSGKDTRMQIRDKSAQLRSQATEFVGDTASQMRSITNKLSNSGREKFEEIKQHGQELAVEQLDHLAKAAKTSKKAIQRS